MVIQDSIILPAINRAVFKSGEERYVLSLEDKEARLLRPEDLIGLSDANVLVISADEESSVEGLRIRLEVERDKGDLVFFVLSSLNKSLELGTRRLAAGYVETLLGNAHIAKYAEDVLFSETFDETENAHLISEFTELSKYTALISAMADKQPALRVFWKALNSLESEMTIGETADEGGTLRAVLLRSMVIPEFTSAIADKDVIKFNRALVNLAVMPDVRKKIPTATMLLNRLRGHLERDKAFNKQNLDTVDKVHAVEDVFGAESGHKFYAPGHMATHKVYSYVKEQIEIIHELLVAGLADQASKTLEDLLAFQKQNGSDEFAAMTLCNVIQSALDTNELDFALLLAKSALELGVEDIYVDTTAAEVYKNLGRFEEAKSLYEKAIQRYGEDSYAINGYADVLKEQGDFTSALKIYNAAAERSPYDAVPANGISTVLFAMGHFEKALAKAQENVTMFGDLVSRIVCGNILRHLGRNHEALRLSKESFKQFPREISLWNGYIKALLSMGKREQALMECERFEAQHPKSPTPLVLKAEALRRLGQLDNSLETYSLALNRFPSNRGLKLGKASVLTLLGKKSESENLVQDIQEPRSEIDWRAFHIWAVAPLAEGKTAEAIGRLENGLAKVPWLRLRTLFSDSLGYALLRAGRRDEAIARFRKGLILADKKKRQGLYLLMSKAFQELGDQRQSRQYLGMVQPKDQWETALQQAVARNASSTTGVVIPFPSMAVQAELQIILAA